MSTDTEYQRHQAQTLNPTVTQYEDGEQSQPMPAQDQTGMDNGSPCLTDSKMAPLVAEYDRHMNDMTEQIRLYQGQMEALRMKLDTVVNENERLYVELRESIEKQLQALPVGAGLGEDTSMDEEAMKKLQDQMQLSLQEKDHALELWQAAAQELDRLQQMYQKVVTDSRLHVAERQTMKNELTQFQQVARQLREANQTLETTNQQFLKTVTEQNSEVENLRSQLRHAKQDLRAATTKMEEMAKCMQDAEEQTQRREAEAAVAHGKEEATERRFQQHQATISQLDAKLKVATREMEQLRQERAAWERQVGELQGRCAALEDEKYEAVAKVRESVQLVEEASLQKEQAFLREKQKAEELEKMMEALKKFIQDAATRTRKEVENVRKQCNVQIHRMAEELSALQLECADKQSQIERGLREREAVEEELGKMYRDGKAGEPEYRKIDTLHERCLGAERLKDDLQITLQTTQNKMKKMEMEYQEELSRSQEEVRRLQVALAGARDDCGSVSEERLRLQQENQQLRREMEELRKISVQTQRKAKQQVSALQHEFSVKEQGLEVRVRELEESGRNSCADLNRLLVAQQRTSKRWKEEARKLTEAFEHKVGSLKAELMRQKQHSQDLEVQLEGDHEKMVESERQMAEYQEKIDRLQRRLTQAEQKASTVSQQLSIVASQRRKAASLIDLETG